jgi:hypothetical protein
MPNANLPILPIFYQGGGFKAALRTWATWAIWYLVSTIGIW